MLKSLSLRIFLVNSSLVAIFSLYGDPSVTSADLGSYDNMVIPTNIGADDTSSKTNELYDLNNTYDPNSSSYYNTNEGYNEE